MRRLICIFLPLSLLLWNCSEDPSDEPELPLEEEADGNDDNIQEDPEDDNSTSGTDTSEAEFGIHRLNITTEGGVAVTSKENYTYCTVTMESDLEEWNFNELPAGIRGRGNSTWEWYPKKPYRLKFEKKQEMLGLDKAKSWVLLANYRDPTDLMNTYVFEMGQRLKMPFTNHSRYVWLTMNGTETGLYQLTEQVQQGETRVDIDDDAGLLLSLDRDDGPELAPDNDDNFWSKVYRMPVCVKHPEDQTSQQLEAIRDELAILENIIKTGTYTEAEAAMDLVSLADYLLIQELVYNVELDAPRSVYMYRDAGSRWTMGPLWDFDAGYDFDWTTMYTGHRYFSNYRELVMGTDPYTLNGQYNPPRFFVDLFRHSEFIEIYKTEWQKIKDLHEEVWTTINKFVSPQYWESEQTLWPIGLQYDRQITAMNNWLHNRINYLDSFIPSL